jgi:hypothetical protein
MLRYLYAHVVITDALDPILGVRRADRVIIFDQKSAVIMLSDAFEGERAIRFATHLHCSGSVNDLGGGEYRLTGGQANLIAGIKGGDKGLSDEEEGEVFVRVLRSASPSRVMVEEPAWIPGYIYGLNNTGQEEISEGLYPRYQRWRLEAIGAVGEGSFLIAISPGRDQVQYSDDTVHLPDAGGIRFGYRGLTAMGIECRCECLMWDEATRHAVATGLRSLRHGDSQITFAGPVDIEYTVDSGHGVIFAQGTLRSDEIRGFQLGSWQDAGEDSWKTHNRYRATLTRELETAAQNEDKA